MNKHFTDTKTSSDIKLPFEVKNPDYNLILQTIEKVTESGDFEPLYDLKNLILDSAV